MATIALCIPAYNASKYLPQLFKSINEQEFLFDEVLVYDDCSKDDTNSIAKKLGATVITGSTNKGCSTGKNELAKFAKSEWLHFHDADDILLPNFTSIVHKWINKTKPADIILLHFHYIDFESKKLLGEPNYNKQKLLEDSIKFVIENKVVNFAIVNKNKFNLIGGFDTDTKVLYNEDKAFYSRAAIAGLSFDYEEKITCINYAYSKSMSKSNLGKCAQAQYYVLEKIWNAIDGKYKIEIAEQLYRNATFSCICNEWKYAIKSITLAKKIAPNYMPK